MSRIVNLFNCFTVAGGRSRLHLLDLGSCERSKSSGGLTLSGLGNVLLAIFNGQKHLPHRSVFHTLFIQRIPSRHNRFIYTYRVVVLFKIITLQRSPEGLGCGRHKNIISKHCRRNISRNPNISEILPGGWTKVR